MPPPRRPGARAGGTARVVLDAMGGDRGPAATVPGALAAHREHGVPVVLVGRAGAIDEELRRHGGAGEVEVLHADDVVPMGERGSTAAFQAKSSLMVGCELARREGAAFVSAGSTGAVVTCAVRVFGRREGVLRPALAVALPARSGFTVLVDAGGTADPSAEMVAQFATLGAEYARDVLGVADPTVGLLSIGAEPGKGNRLARDAALLLPTMPVRFHGNVEGHDVLAGTVDVVVTDGFTGNVVLKNIEGCVRTTLGLLAGTGSVAAAPLEAVARLYTADTHGGAALLGLTGTVVVAHGSSTTTAIARACVVARGAPERPEACDTGAVVGGQGGTGPGG